MKYIDCHAHLNFAAYDPDRAEAFARAQEAGVAVVNVGTQKDTSESAVKFAEENEGAHAIVGLHPIHTSKSYHDEAELGSPNLADGQGETGFTSRGEVFDYDFYKTLAQNEKVIGIGECGLDYFRLEDDTKEKQVEAFKQQIALANEVNKPLMLHVRPGKGGEAYKDAVEILKSEAKVRGNSHFFAGTLEEAKMFLDMGYTMSFTGVITFTSDYDELVKYVPLDMMLSETDCPYVTPAPHRGKRNEPLFVTEVVRRIAEIKQKPLEEVQAQLLKNAEDFFKIDLSTR